MRVHGTASFDMTGMLIPAFLTLALLFKPLSNTVMLGCTLRPTVDGGINASVSASC